MLRVTKYVSQSVTLLCDAALLCALLKLLCDAALLCALVLAVLLCCAVVVLGAGVCIGDTIVWCWGAGVLRCCAVVTCGVGAR